MFNPRARTRVKRAHRSHRSALGVWAGGLALLATIGAASGQGRNFDQGREPDPSLAPTPGTGVPDEVTGDSPPEEVAEEAGIVDMSGDFVPLDLVFDDELGADVTLGDYFDGERPVILALVYYRCPSLCNLVLNGLTDVLKEMDWTPGQEFELVTVSINPQETANLARGKKESYIYALGKPEAAAGWHFLTGLEANIRPLAESVGFGYRFDMQDSEYAHSAAIFVLTPDGRISRTLYGVYYQPRTVKFSLFEAADGKIGTPLDRLVLYCYHYDPVAGEYTPAVMNIMRLAATATVVLLGGMIGFFLWLDRRRRAGAARAGEPQPLLRERAP
jgi:protein SCO1